MIALARKTLLYEWRRFLPAVFSVGFSGLLLLIEAAVVLGIFGSASVYMTHSDTDIWIGYPHTPSVDQGRSINPGLIALLLTNPAVAHAEPFDWVDGEWDSAHASGISVYVCGIDPQPNGLMFAHALPQALRTKLSEPGAVIVDRSDLRKLGVRVGGLAVINGRQVRVVGVTHGLRALGGVNVLASLRTAREINGDTVDAERPTYLVASLNDPSRASAVAAQLRGHGGFGPYQVWTASALAHRSVMFWLFNTGAGSGVLFMAGIVFLVGAVITSQTLMGAVATSVREYATLNALGVGVRALRWVVLEQAFWIGATGLVGAALIASILLLVARGQDVPLAINAPISLACAALILILATLSGLVAIRSLRRADPATLLR